jgi:regulator of replication initiation timing
MFSNIELVRANTKIDRLEQEIAKLRQQNVLLLEENHLLHRRVNELLERMAAFDPLFELNDSSHTEPDIFWISLRILGQP